VVIDDADSRRELSGGFRLTTNNRMEMTAAIVALEQLQGCGKPVMLYSDSAYLVNGINQGWARNWRARGWRKSDGAPALNIDLWTRLLNLLEGLNITLFWVKGHAGNELNERCDQLAVVALRGDQLPPDQGYESTGAQI
jgi:ribonuclease HI